MKTYMFTETESDKRGYNVCINLYAIKGNVPEFISCSHHNTASWRGARGQAGQLLHKIHPRIKFDGYRLTSNNIRLFSIDGGNVDHVKKEATQ